MTTASASVIVPHSLELTATVLFALAVLHTFAASKLQAFGSRFPEGSVPENLFHLLGEVEVVFGLWAGLLFLAFGFQTDFTNALNFTESLNFTEPLFVLAIMTIAATRPVITAAEGLIQGIPNLPGIPKNLREPVRLISILTLGPLLGSFITEPAAMTVTAILLLNRYLRSPETARQRSPWFLHGLLAVLFVNVSIGGVLTPYAAPPVLMVASKWNWTLETMLDSFGWRAALAVFLNAVLFTATFRNEIHAAAHGADETPATGKKVPLWLIVIHVAALLGVVLTSHHPVVSTGILLYFLGIAAVTQEYQSELRLRESLLVAFFLGGLVYFSPLQAWWIRPLLDSFSSFTLFLGASALTAITDNAAVTTLGSLSPTLSEASKHALVAGAVTGGGLTLIANAPNPAGYAILKDAFGDRGVGAGRLFLAALLPTLIAGCCLMLL
jgi:hypothetical protein